MSEKPQDFVQVPREPTPEMLKAAANACGSDSIYRNAYRAMIEAAPPAPEGWRTIETAPKDETRILVFFKNGLGVREVQWTSTWSDNLAEHGLWHVDDNKHGPYPLRGYSDGDDTHWQPLPPAPGDEKGKGGENSASEEEHRHLFNDPKINFADIASLHHASRHFGVTLKAAYLRAKELGLLSYQSESLPPPAVEGQG